MTAEEYIIPKHFTGIPTREEEVREFTALADAFNAGLADREQYAKQRAMEFDQWNEKNGWEYDFRAQRRHDLSELYDLFINDTKK